MGHETPPTMQSTLAVRGVCSTIRPPMETTTPGKKKTRPNNHEPVRDHARSIPAIDKSNNRAPPTNISCDAQLVESVLLRCLVGFTISSLAPRHD